MAGNQSRGLIAASRMRGWDPTRIEGDASILPNFDKDQGNLPGPPVGSIPGGTPIGWPDGVDVSGPQADTPVTFRTPDTSRTNPSLNRTRGESGDPFSGKGGM